MSTISFNTTVNCPHRNNIHYADVEATYSSERIPKTEQTCPSCGGKFSIMATVDIDVEIIK